ncbi:Protein-L-isoaspartate O-methyltransferase [Chitinispirillum alkaliphilum]|nr:Protein-L-isoaspartate O-methyltransferase [Chitinispirillum alkaliphilum]
MQNLSASLTSVQKAAIPIKGSASDFDKLMEDIGEARIVLLGEATHGSHEFYQTRAMITARLIEEKKFNAVAVEADWPDAYRVNKFVRSFGDMKQAIESLEEFKRFPKWMWRNADMLQFVQYLREHNEELAPESGVGFYGLDLYSLYSSIDAVISYLEKVDPQAAEQARKRYSCFEQYGPESQSYGLAMRYVHSDCRQQAIAQLQELRNKSVEYMRRNGFVSQEEQFFAEQNARVAQDAEEYYRAMFSGRVSSWNLRDKHMANTLNELILHLSKFSSPKVVVWEHNSHLGDARATEVHRYGEINLGQLLRERYGNGVFSVGFTTHTGTVSAASSWGGEVERKNINPSLPESYEYLFHQTGIPSFYLNLQNNPELDFLKRQHLERAIGVIYLPQSEKVSHYFRASLPQQFDSVIHIDHTSAVVPLEYESGWEEGEPLPPTYSSGL